MTQGESRRWETKKRYLSDFCQLYGNNVIPQVGEQAPKAAQVCCYLMIGGDKIGET